MPDLKWYLARALAMSPREVVYRLRQKARHRVWRAALRAGSTQVNAPQPDFAGWSPESLGIDVSGAKGEVGELLQDVEAIHEGRWWFFGLDLLEEEIDWHRDPASGTVAPRRFAFDIDHRDELLVGNIKNTWEKSRHHHLTQLAAAYRITGDEKHAELAAAQLLDWIEQNPVLAGVNWTHPLEHGIRLIGWVWIERLLRGSRAHTTLFSESSPFWESFYQHQWFIRNTLSCCSSANNHLIGELAGLFVAAAALPLYPESWGWAEFAWKALEREMVKQTTPSGINRELAFPYQIFVLEFLVLAALEFRRSGRVLPPLWQERLGAMVRAAAQLTDVGDNLPRYGDGDEGRAILLHGSSTRRDGWLFRAVAALTGEAVPEAEDGRLPVALFGLSDESPEVWTPAGGGVGFEQAGLYQLSLRRNTPEEVMVLADAGPLGYLSIAAHGHADALSFTLSRGGVPIIVDPGTFAYHTDPEWRGYFRGSSAHSTVVVDGADQSEQAGAFLWTRKAKCMVKRWEASGEQQVLEASHDGYRRFGVIHTRQFELDDSGVRIRDTLSGSGEHSARLLIQLAPDCKVTERGAGVFELSCDGQRVRLTFPPDLESSREQGWYSPLFGVKQPSSLLRADWRGALPVTFETAIVLT